MNDPAMPATQSARARGTLFAGLLFLAAGPLLAWSPPVEPPRIEQSSLTAVYAPTFGIFSDSSLPLTDDFRVDGSWVNLFPSGQNLNFYFGLSHAIKDAPVFPYSSRAQSSFDLVQQVKDSIYGEAVYVFFDYFQLTGKVEYLQNRNVDDAPDYADYNFDRLTLSGGLVLDLRYSAVEKYYKGKQFLFPQEGFLASLGMSENHYVPVSGGWASWSPQAVGETQVLIHPLPFWVLSFDASGRANLQSNTPRAQAATSTVEGALDAAGDYAVDGNAELRFLHPAGLFWESPEFWYMSSFLFKFSPGFILGYDAGAVGLYGAGPPTFQQSVYLSFLVALRMNGELITVFRTDFAVAQGGHYKVVLSLSIGTVGTGKPSTLLKSEQH